MKEKLILKDYFAYIYPGTIQLFNLFILYSLFDFNIWSILKGILENNKDIVEILISSFLFIFITYFLGSISICTNAIFNSVTNNINEGIFYGNSKRNFFNEIKFDEDDSKNIKSLVDNKELNSKDLNNQLYMVKCYIKTKNLYEEPRRMMNLLLLSKSLMITLIIQVILIISYVGKYNSYRVIFTWWVVLLLISIGLLYTRFYRLYLDYVASVYRNFYVYEITQE